MLKYQLIIQHRQKGNNNTVVQSEFYYQVNTLIVLCLEVSLIHHGTLNSVLQVGFRKFL